MVGLRTLTGLLTMDSAELNNLDKMLSTHRKGYEMAMTTCVSKHYHVKRSSQKVTRYSILVRWNVSARKSMETASGFSSLRAASRRGKEVRYASDV